MTFDQLHRVWSYSQVALEALQLFFPSHSPMLLSGPPYIHTDHHHDLLVNDGLGDGDNFDGDDVNYDDGSHLSILKSHPGTAIPDTS